MLLLSVNRAIVRGRRVPLSHLLKGPSRLPTVPSTAAAFPLCTAMVILWRRYSLLRSSPVAWRRRCPMSHELGWVLSDRAHWTFPRQKGQSDGWPSRRHTWHSSDTLLLLPRPPQCGINTKLEMAMTNGIKSVSNRNFSICTMCSNARNPAFFMLMPDC